MSVDEIKKHVDALEHLIKEMEVDAAETEELRHKKEQLQTVKRSIAQLEKKGIPIPKEMQELKLSLVNALENGRAPIDGLVPVYDRLLDLIVDLGWICGRRPRKDLYQKAKERKAKTTSAETIEKALVDVLREMGGSAHEKDILQKIKQRLKAQLTEADVERPQGKTPRWQLSLRKARRALVDSGTLNPASKGRTWTLAK